MKNRKLLSFLVFIILSFCLPTFAQDVDKEQTPEEKQNEIEVTKFADSFLESFIETQDLEKIPQFFFEKDFKTRFAENSDLNDTYLVDNSKKSQATRLYAFHNFSNLIPLIMSFKCSDIRKVEKSEDIKNLKNCFPDTLLERLENTKWLKLLYEDDVEEPEKYDEASDFIAEIEFFSNYMREYLKFHPINKENLEKLQKHLPTYYGYEKCNGNRCIGLLEGTEIFAIHRLMMCLRIAKIDGQWKIVQIYSVASED